MPPVRALSVPGVPVFFFSSGTDDQSHERRAAVAVAVVGCLHSGMKCKERPIVFIAHCIRVFTQECCTVCSLISVDHELRMVECMVGPLSR